MTTPIYFLGQTLVVPLQLLIRAPNLDLKLCPLLLRLLVLGLQLCHNSVGLTENVLQGHRISLQGIVVLLQRQTDKQTNKQTNKVNKQKRKTSYNK